MRRTAEVESVSVWMEETQGRRRCNGCRMRHKILSRNKTDQEEGRAKKKDTNHAGGDEDN